MASTNIQLIICQLLNTIIMSDFVRFLKKFQIQTKIEGPKTSLFPSLQARYIVNERNQFHLPWFVLSESVLVLAPGDRCFFS